MKKAILLLHGFKRNGEDDFINLHEYFEKYKSEYDIINEIYFDNYKLETLNKNYLNEEVNRVVEQVKEYDELLIIGYSTGSIIASMITSKLPNNVKYKLFAIVPPINIILFKWVPMGFRIWKKERSLKKKLGKERYESIKKASQNSKNMEKYPVQISKHINNVRLKNRKLLIEENNAVFLLSSTDSHVKTDAIVKKLAKHDRDITILPFEHPNIMKSQKDIFIEWFEEKNKDQL